MLYWIQSLIAAIMLLVGWLTDDTGLMVAAFLLQTVLEYQRIRH